MALDIVGGSEIGQACLRWATISRNSVGSGIEQGTVKEARRINNARFRRGLRGLRGLGKLQIGRRDKTPGTERVPRSF